ncbi:MAG: flagellar hook-length control protein FliK [Alphaproteobacteria bacterium]|nr:flagellar hook-length control protein FliK [Alphaproteobacteria bacterium]MBU2085450.1 flagellar hook-length control protein FliK [Alphaproteobacteria bacterium]MBU2143482.1 flagellar hook-length control protein FliK [Alphaproteobacteria bacterium]MBU2196129.1 flagellar hook-length control protein FliK [Alphaproteobacteria bacterium]
MTFLLETDFTARRSAAPGETASRSRGNAKETGSGAEFARSLAGADSEQPAQDTATQQTGPNKDIKSAARPLVEQSQSELPAPDAATAADQLPDIRSDIIVDGEAGEDAETEFISPETGETDAALPSDAPAQIVVLNTAPAQTPDDIATAEPSDAIAAESDVVASPPAAVSDAQRQTTDAATPSEAANMAPDTTSEAVVEAPATQSSATTNTLAQSAAASQVATATARSEKSVSAPAAAPDIAETAPHTNVRQGEKHRAETPTIEVDSTDSADLLTAATGQNDTAQLAAGHGKAAPADPAAMGMTAGTLSPSVSQSAAPAAPPVMTPTNALVVATPAEVVDIISDSLASPDEKKNHIHIQLDPPELGRVSIDFKFDAHGLQHVTIFGETPDAMRQLRLMHFELVNALERQGLSSQNMSFQQHQTPQDQGQQTGRDIGTSERGATGQTSRATPELIAQNIIQSRPTLSAGLNIKL